MGTNRGSSRRKKSPAKSDWYADNETIQISRLSGVVNALAADADNTNGRIGSLGDALRDGSYRPNNRKLSHQLLSKIWTNL